MAEKKRLGKYTIYWTLKKQSIVKNLNNTNKSSFLFYQNKFKHRSVEAYLKKKIWSICWTVPP